MPKKSRKILIAPQKIEKLRLNLVGFRRRLELKTSLGIRIPGCLREEGSEILAAEGVGWPYSLASAICLWISLSRTRRLGDPPISGSLSFCIDGWLFWRAAIWTWSWLLSRLNASCSRMIFLRSRDACFRMRFDWACCSSIYSFMSASIWRSWSSYGYGGPWGEEPVSSVVRDWSSVSEEVVPSAVLIALLLNVALLTACFFEAIVNMEEAFWGGF